MPDTKITDDHFCFWIEYYDKKRKKTVFTDVNEEIDVYENYIRYENYCPWCWEDYYDFAYKIEWDKLFVKTINFEHVQFSWKNREAVLYKFIKDWKYNEEEVKRWEFKNGDEIKAWLDRFEFKGQINDVDRYSKTAKDWIMKQIKNKNFKED